MITSRAIRSNEITDNSHEGYGLSTYVLTTSSYLVLATSYFCYLSTKLVDSLCFSHCSGYPELTI